MSRPRVFVSSTYYDLRHVRALLDQFIESLGFDSILSEKGDVAYVSSVPLDESCYREVLTADMFVLIVGGRYGSAASDESAGLSPGFWDKYDSITRKEFDAAIQQDIPTYILVDRSVYDEFRTYQRNRSSETIHYAHVDSINIFKLLDEIVLRPRNNPIQTFDRVSEITDWLREQWAGLFRELLNTRTDQEQLKDLNQNVDELRAVNETLKTYLEVVLRNVEGEEQSRSVIDAEDRRLNEFKAMSLFLSNPLVGFLGRHHMDVPQVQMLITQAPSFKDFLQSLLLLNNKDLSSWVAEREEMPGASHGIYLDFLKARQNLGLPLVPKLDASDEIPPEVFDELAKQLSLESHLHSTDEPVASTTPRKRSPAKKASAKKAPARKAAATRADR